ncbi:MAG: ThuA domain-containing protein [Acidobacteriota bacterium]
MKRKTFKPMNNLFSKLGILFVVSLFLLICVSTSYAKPNKLLVVTVTKGYKHQSIPVLEKVIEDLGKINNKYTVDFARTDKDLAMKMNAAGLQDYDGVVFASTTGDLPLPDKEAFLKWIKAGNAFIGIHSATDTFHNFQPFIEMIGGEFSAHGPQLKVSLISQDIKHPATKHLSKTTELFDEIYVFKSFVRENVQVLLSLDKNPNQKDKEDFNKPGFYPIAWCRRYGKGRVFYTALGHREDVIESEIFKKHLLGGINWSLK